MSTVGRVVGRMSFRTRLSTFTALAVGITVALAAAASYFVVRHQLLAQADSSLSSEVTTAQAFSPRGTIDTSVVLRIIGHTGGGFFQVILPDGTVYYSSFETVNSDPRPLYPSQADELIAQGPADGGSRMDTVRYDGVPYRVITESAFAPRLGPVAIQVGRSLTDIYHTLATLRLILILVGLGGIAAAVGFGYLIGRTTLRPVRRLTAAAEHVAATQDLGSTIEEDGDDELARLARSFNSMLTALAASRQQQAQLISDAGHELRTPLTSLRTNIEVLMRVRDLPEWDRTELVRDVEAQLGELTNLIGDVVDLARQEEKQPDPIEVRLDDIVRRAVERARRRAPGLVFDPHLTSGSVRAQPGLLERAVLNVLDNAAKWSPPGGTVDIWLQRGGCWTLDIHDHGPGISPEDLPHIFDRFYRAPSARSMPGSGLGLAIVQQVVSNHGGTVAASVPAEGGTLVHIELPIVEEAEPETQPLPPAPADGYLSSSSPGRSA